MYTLGSKGVLEPHFTGFRNGTGMPNSGPAGFRNPDSGIRNSLGMQQSLFSYV
jgi:hypothetical protein